MCGGHLMEPYLLGLSSMARNVALVLVENKVNLHNDKFRQLLGLTQGIERCPPVDWRCYFSH